METKLNLHELVQLNKLEDIFSSLIQRLNSQEIAIAELKNQSSNFVTCKEVNNSFLELSQSIDKQALKIEYVSRQASTAIDGQHISAGDLAVINYGKIKDITKNLNLCLQKVEFDDKIDDMISKNTKEFTEIREWATPLDYTHKLQDEQKLVFTRLQAIESILPCKLDRSEWGHIEGIVKRIELYAKFKEETNEILRKLQLAHKSSQETLSNQSAKLKDYEKQLKNLESESRKLAPKTETRALAKDMHRIEMEFDKFVHRSNKAVSTLLTKTDCIDMTRKISQGVAELDTRLCKAENRIDNQTEQINILEKDIALKATVKEVANCVTRRHFEEAVTTLGSTLDKKAAKNAFQDLVSEFQSLHTCVHKDFERINVAMRFLEWFTARGENYEHNMRLIDKHLNGLAKGSIPDGQTRQPFSGQIRFTPLDPNE